MRAADAEIHLKRYAMHPLQAGSSADCKANFRKLPVGRYS